MTKDLHSNIHFFFEEIEFDLPDHGRLRQWLSAMVSQEEVKVEMLNFIFCSDDYLLEINRTYLNHDYYTDIITFPYQEGSILESDIFISIDRIKENSQNENSSIEQELLRVMAHGVLHLCGYGDKEASEILIMRTKEDEAIQAFVL